MGLVSELRRRNVLRMAVLYAVAAWLVMQVAEVVIGLANLPDWIGPTILVLLAVGFPIALLFSWFYELTPEGVSLDKDIKPGERTARSGDRRVDFVVISVLTAAVLMFAYDKWWTPGPSDKSVAVLAFENMSDDPDQEYFSDGIAEELLNALAQIPELQVISRSSAFSFKGKNIAIPEIAKQLNVAHVLEGSVRRTGDRVRITAQLIDAATDAHIWSETYDRELLDIFAVQDEIAAAISGELKVKLTPDSRVSSTSVAIRPTGMGTYDAYLKARELISLRDEESVWRAIQHLERALLLDDNFAPAHAQLAIAAILISHKYEPVTWEERTDSARLHLDKAQALDPDLFDAHGGRALFALRVEEDPLAAIEHAERALALNPSYIDAMNWLHVAYGQVGRLTESDAMLEQMLILDPLSTLSRANYIERLFYLGRIEEAHEHADRLAEQNPGRGFLWHAGTSLRAGDVVEAMEWGLKAGRETDNYGPVWQIFLFLRMDDELFRLFDGQSLIDGMEGRWDKIIADMEETIEAYPLLGQLPLDLAHAYYHAGRYAEAASYYQRFFDSVPEGQLYMAAGARGPIFETMPIISLMRFAQALRLSGDEQSAQAAVQIARQGQAELLAAGRRNSNRSIAEAMIAAFDGDPVGAIAGIEAAIRQGLGVKSLVEDPVFELVANDPRLAELRAQMDNQLAADKAAVLQLICFNNPAPDAWQPLPQTCEGVIEQSARL